MTTRLRTWKQIAAFFGTTERTVMRWEAERGLPVHRMPGEARSSVYADTGELTAWLNESKAEAEPEAAPEIAPEAAPDPAPPPPPETPPETPALKLRLPPLWPLAAAGIAVAVAMAAIAAFAPVLPHSPHVAPQAAQALYVRAMQSWNARTPAGLNAAVDGFNKAIAIDPAYADAYVGLANSYNLLPEYTVMPRSQAYPLAEAAAQKAIALDERDASAHAALAFSLFYGDWNGKAADREFARAIALEPGNATIQHWYGTFLHALGREPEALAHMNQALALNPSSQAIQADRGVILYYNGRTAEAEAILTAMTRSDPDFRSPHFYLTQIYLPEGRDADYVRELRTSARLGGDLLDEGVAQAAETGLRSGGHDGMLRAILARRLSYFQSGAGSPYEIAVFCAMLGRRDDAASYLRVALDRHDDGIINAPSEKRMGAVRDTDIFKTILRRLST